MGTTYGLLDIYTFECRRKEHGKELEIIFYFGIYPIGKKRRLRRAEPAHTRSLVRALASPIHKIWT